MKKYSVIVGVSLLIGSIFGILISKWTLINPTFWNMKITDIVHILVTIIIACFVTNLINDKLNNNIRKRELLLELFDKLNVNIQSIYDNGNDYMRASQPQLGRSILATFKNTNNLLDFIKKVSSSKKICNHTIFDDTLIENIRYLKAILTESRFLTENPNYDEDTIKSFNEIHDKIVLKIYNSKINIYT